VRVPKREIDDAALERWQQTQAAIHSPAEPTSALACEGDNFEGKVEALLAWQ